jgi:hypothetical protein
MSDRCKKEDKLPEVYMPSLQFSKNILEAVDIGGHPTWLGYNATEKKFFTHTSVMGEEEIIYPVGKDRISYTPYAFTHEEIARLTNEPVQIPKFETIYQKYYDEFDIFLDIDDIYRHLETTFCFETYQQHRLNSTGYLYHTGEHDSGKTRPLELQKRLAYRPLFATEINEANIYEVIGTRQEGLCTILEDEAQELSKPENAGKMAIYRAGYRSGQTVPRILDGSSSNRKMLFYNVFCCKAFSGYNFPRKDDAFKSRCIEVPFTEGTPKKDELTKDDDSRMAQLKKPLLLWRMLTYFDPTPEFELPIKNRTKEVWKGKIIAASKYPKICELMQNLAVQEQTKRFKNLHDSLEAHIAKAVIYTEEFYEWKFVPFSQIWFWLLVALDIPNAKEKINAIKVYSDTIGMDVTKNLVGRKLDSALHGVSMTKFKIGAMW